MAAPMNSTAKADEEEAQALQSAERRRRRREGWLILIAALLILLFAFFEDILPDVSADYTLVSNIAFFLLVNLNIILLALLVFLVVRNLLKLVLDRRRRILGSRLQARLVFAFIGLSLVPTVLLFLTAGSLVTRSVDKWFDAQVVNALRGSLDISSTYYQNSADNALFFAR